MNAPGIYWVRRYGTEKWSVAQLRGDGWLMFGATMAAKRPPNFAEIGEQITIPIGILASSTAGSAASLAEVENREPQRWCPQSNGRLLEGS
jgi:hypothetical protein